MTPKLKGVSGDCVFFVFLLCGHLSLSGHFLVTLSAHTPLLVCTSIYTFVERLMLMLSSFLLIELQMNPKFLRNLRFAKKGNKKSKKED